MKNSNLIRTVILAGSLLLQLNTICLQSRGAAGDVDLSFDPGFGINGWPNNYEYPFTWVNALVAQPDGKIIIGGSFTTVKGLVRTNIARLNADGSGDSSFVSAPMNYPVSSLALQSDGKVLVGSLGPLNPAPEVGLMRLNSDGSPDTNFNANAYVAIGLADINTIVVQPDGKILIGGKIFDYDCGDSGCYESIVARLNTNGTRDSNFVSGAVSFGDVTSMALQPDGKLLVSGVGIWRLQANGSLDNTFNPAGGGVPIALQPDGKVLVGGYARLNADGSLDNSFNPGTGAHGIIQSIALQSDGKVIIGGQFVSINGHSRTNLARLNSDGSMDMSFPNGTGGVSGGPQWYGGPSVRAIALQTNGTMLIGGAFTTVNGTNRSCIARLNADGSLNVAFQPGGQGVDPISSPVFQADGKLLVGPLSSLVVQADGKVLIGGALTFINGTNRYASARLNADGSRDETFIAATNFHPDLLALRRYDDCAAAGQSGCALTAYATSVAVQSDGKVLIGGTVETIVADQAAGYLYYYRPILGRFYADGSLDTNFAPVFFGYSGLWIDDVSLQPDGKIIVSGPFVSVNGTNRNGLARLNTNRTLDLSFAPATGASAWISSVAVQPDGKVLIAGSFVYVNDTNRTGIWRLQANGSRDNTFNAITGPNATVSAFALQPDGKVIIVGSFTNINGTNLTSIARLNANGSLDGSFNPGTIAPWGVNAIALQSNGDVLIGGGFLTVNGVFRPYVARLYGDSAPSLTIAQSNASVIVSWPSPATGFELQQTTDLKTTNWTASFESVTDNGTTRSITVSPAPGNRYFRLFKP